MVRNLHRKCTDCHAGSEYGEAKSHKWNWVGFSAERYSASFNSGQVFRVFTADKIENITVGGDQGRNVFPTVMKRTMKNVKTGHRSEVTFTSVSYNHGLKESDFSERRMRRPPREGTR
jgi:hypothetical protein